MPIIPTRPRAGSPACCGLAGYGTVALQAAATAALSANVRSYRFVQQLLAKEAGLMPWRTPPAALVPMPGLRGPAYYH